MTNSSDTQLQSIDSTMLTPIVRQAIDSQTAEVTEWRCQPLLGGASNLTVGVYHLTGTATDQGDAVPWSLVLKITQLPPNRPAFADPADCNYWKREVEAFRSGLLEDLPGVSATRCYGVVERPDGTFWIWMDHVEDAIGPRWPLKHFGVVARHLGQFNGTYMMDRPIPSRPWLSKRWLQQRTENWAPGVALLSEHLDHPLVARVYSPETAEGLFRLWRERDTLYDVLDRLPQALCHMEAFRRNLFAQPGADGGYETMLIDWAFVGTGAVGEEIAPLVQQSVMFFDVEMSEARELDAIAFDGYVEGLRDAGWQGDARMARLGYAAASALRSFFGLWGSLGYFLDERLQARFEEVMQRPIEDMVDAGPAFNRFHLDLAEEARRLMDEL